MGVSSDDWASKPSTSWERSLAQGLTLAKLVKGDKFASQVLVAQNASANAKASVSWDDLSSGEARDLKDIGTSCVNDIQNYGEQSYTELDDEKEKKKSSADWQKALDDGERTAIKKNDDAISAAYDSARNKIATLPDDKRDAGAGLFNGLAGGITTAWSTILETLTGLFNYIADFLKKVWDGIVKYGKTIISACTKAFSFITNFI